MSFIKRLFNIGKKEEEIESKLDYEITDLKVGFMFDYDLKNWVVKDVAMYRWDNGIRDYEYTIVSGTEKLFLYFAQADNLTSIFWKVKLKDVLPDARNLMREGKMDLDFSYNNKTYHPAGTGCARVKTSKERYELENWMYECEDEESIISFNRYEDGSSDVYEGKYIGEEIIGNIIPKG